MLKRTKKARKQRLAVRKWRKKFQDKNLVYRKLNGHYTWIAKKV